MLINSIAYRCFQLYLGLTFLQLIKCDCLLPKNNSPKVRFAYEEKDDAHRMFVEEYYVLQFKCFTGYTLFGNAHMQCVDGKWNGVVPTCERSQCSHIPIVGNATYEVKSSERGALHIGSLVTYSCKRGYEFNDTVSPTLRCRLDRRRNKVKWYGKVPFCRVKVPCPDPGVSDRGEREGPCCLSGDVLQFSCDENHELVGNENIRCLSTGSWTSGRPLCRPSEDHCDFPPPIPHGVMTGEKDGDYFMPYEEAQILCAPGYKYYGPSEFVVCEEGGEWEKEFGECKEIFCSPPELLENGYIFELETSNLTSFPYKFTLTYKCDDGYRLLGGDSWRICGKNGWSGRTPYCEEVKCPDPGAPEDGVRIASTFKVGEKVIFKCYTGYYLLGSFERYCMPNGQWTGDLARCDAPSNYCPNPGIPVNGFKTNSNYDKGQKVRFGCQPGYFLVGSEFRECLEDKTWSGREAKCKSPYDFDNRAQISEILKTKVEESFEEEKKEKYEFQNALHSSWRNGSVPVGKILDINHNGLLILYFAFDVSGSVEYHNFRRSIEFAKAIVKKVGISPDRARAGALTFSSVAENKFLPGNVNTTEEVLTALDNIEYTGGGTAASSALSVIRMENMALDDKLFDKKNRKTVIFLLTDGKTNMGGNPEEEANMLKDAGAEIYCIGITGDVRAETLYSIASIPKDSKDERPNVFILQNYDTLAWLVQEITNGTLDYSHCGLGLEKVGEQQDLGRILNGNHSVESWPWMAALFFLPKGESNFERADLLCGGSIIHRNFILTAAHCMYHTDKDTEIIRLRKEKEIIIRLGLVDVQNLTYVQEYEVSKMYIHPNYRAGPSFDYDIALLQLDRPISFSRFVRPVCLPPKVLPKDSSFYSSQDFGWATGWGHAGKLEPGKRVASKSSRYLKEIRLPIQSRQRCTLSMEDNKYDLEYFTDRMFCAGDGKSDRDTCRGDSGGPLMQSQMNSDGYRYWTQVGIISWGMGCGQNNTYGYYTHVQKLRSWIDDSIENVLSKIQ